MGGSSDLSLRVVLSASDLASNRLKTFGSTLINLAGDAGPLLKVFGGISLAAIGFAAASVQMAAKYQQSMNMVQALTGASQAQMSQYDAGLKALAIDSGVAPLKLSQGLYYVISAGYQGADAMKMLTLSTEDAVIGMTDSKVTANALTTVMQGFNEKTSDMVKVNGEMIRTVTLGKMSMQDYAGAVSKVAVLHAQFHVTLEDTNATLATLTSSGYKSAAIAATAYGQLVGIMDGKTDLMTKRIHKLGLNFDEAKFKQMDYQHQLAYLNQTMQGHYDQLQNVLGGSKQAASAFTTLETHSKMFADNLKALSDQQKNATATQKAWAITQGGFTQSMARAGAIVQVLMINIGQQLLPVLTKLVQAVVPIVTWLMNFATAVGHNEVAMAFLKGALVGFVVVLLSILIPAFWAWAVAAGAAAIATLAATWPILLIGAIVAVVVAGIILAIQHWGAIGTWLHNVWNTVTSGIGRFFAMIGGWIHNLGKTFSGLAAPVKIALGILLIVAAPFIAPIVAIIFVITHLGQVFASLGNQASQAADKVALAHAKMRISSDDNQRKQAVKTIINLEKEKQLILTHLRQRHSAIAGLVMDHQLQMVNQQIAAQNARFFAAEADKQRQLQQQKILQDKLQEDQKNWFVRLLDDILGFFGMVFGAIGGFFGNIFSKIGQFKDAVIQKFQDIWHGVVTDFTTIMNGIGTAATAIWDGVGKGIKNAINFLIGLVNGVIQGIDHVHVSIAGHDIGFSIPQIPLLAAGGTIPPGGFAIAGDAGPELIAGGMYGKTVFNNAQTQGILGGSQGRGHTTHYHYSNITINAPNARAADVALLVKQQYDRDFRRSGSIVTTTSGGRAS